MDKVGKIMTFVFIILLVVVVVEFSFIFLSPKLKNNPAQLTIFPTQTVIPTVLPIVTTVGSATPIPKDQAINPGELTSLSKLKKDLLVAATMSNTFQGEITTMDRQPGTTKSDLGDPFKYVLKIVLKGSSGSSQNFYTDDLKSVNVFEKVGSQERPIDISSLKIGDNIMITVKFNMLDETDILSNMKIVKI